MKKSFVFLCIIAALSVLIISISFTLKKIKAPVPVKRINVKNKFTVLELFTSQGCSSCPPADRLLGKYADKENIIALSFHVDYWNRLGWKDPFSKAEFSERQHEYAQAFRLDGVYTPQAIVNGEKEMVGSDESKISAVIQKSQSDESLAQVTIDEITSDGSKAIISYTLNGQINNSVLHIALVQHKTSTSIKAGENNGVQLTNYNVVRNFESLNSITAGKSSASIDLINGIDKKDFSVILYVQDNKSKILAAAQSSL